MSREAIRAFVYFAIQGGNALKCNNHRRNNKGALKAAATPGGRTTTTTTTWGLILDTTEVGMMTLGTAMQEICIH
jgi:hypothetical protein